MTLVILLACNGRLDRPEDPLSVSSLQIKHEKLQEKWAIDTVSGDVLELATTGEWGAAGVAAEQHFLLEPNWFNVEQWVLNDAFSPYPNTWTDNEVSQLKSYLSEEHQAVLQGLQSLKAGDSPKGVDAEGVWGLWYEFRRVSNLEDEAATRSAAEEIRRKKPHHLDACLYLIRERKTHRDYGEISHLLNTCQSDNASSSSLRRQAADFYDGIGEHGKAHGLYKEIGLDLHALVIAYQEGWYSDFSEVPLNVLEGKHLDTSLHMVWIGIEFQQKDLVQKGLIRLQGFEEPVAWAAKGAGHLSMGEPEKALEAMSNAGGAAVLALKARAHFDLGDHASANLAIEEALQLQPWNPWIHLVAEMVGSNSRDRMKRDPLEIVVLGLHRDRYRPWHLIADDKALKNETESRDLLTGKATLPEDCEEMRACWSLKSKKPESDPRWDVLTSVEQRYVRVLHGKTPDNASDFEHERDWYATGLHKMIVDKQDNLP